MNCGSAGISKGLVSSGPNPNQCTETLTGIANAQYTMVTLNNVLDSQNNNGTVSATMAVLTGDVNASGRIDVAGVSIARQQTLTSLPPPP
jgi:hypothetical protein